MKFNKILIFLIIVYGTFGYARPRVTIDKNPFQIPMSSQMAFVQKYAFLNPNNIRSMFYNSGIFNQDLRTTNTPGFEWPKNSGLCACFTAGLTIMSYINDSLAACMASYKGEYVNGAIKYVNGVPTYDNDNTKFRIYSVKAGDNASTNSDYADWGNMVPYGAPYYDVNQNGQYDPGVDIPGMKNSAQTLFQVLTDISTENKKSSEGFSGGVYSPLLNVEIHFTAWAYNTTGMEDLEFVNWVVINKGLSTWKKTYLSVVVDPDLGDANDDYIGCDTVNKINLGYCYNGDNYDDDYGAAPPAFGMDYFKSPIIKKTGQPNDTLGLTSFVFFTNLGSNPPTCEKDPESPSDSYNYVRGLKRDGTPFLNPLFTPAQRTKYLYPGDPENNTGWTELKGSIQNCGGDTTGTIITPNPIGDRRFIFNSGRDDFEFNPGDTQNIVLAQFVARSSSNLKSVTKLKTLAKTAKIIYLADFNVTPPPPAPVVTTSFTPLTTSGTCNISLTWGDVSESYKYWDSVFFYASDSNIYTFEGYEVYEINKNNTASLPEFNKPETMDLNSITLIDAFDLVNDRGYIIDTFATGVTVNGNEQYGVFPIVPPYKMTAGSSFPNKGVKRGITLTSTKYSNNYGGQSSFIYGQEYRFAVVAYAVSISPRLKKGFKTIRNSVSSQIIKVKPMAPPAGSNYSFKNGDTLNSNIRDLGIIPIIRNQESLLNATYRTVFNPVTGTSDTTYNILRKINGAATFDTVYKNVYYTQNTTPSSDMSAKTIDGVLLKLTKIRYSDVDALQKVGVIKDLNSEVDSDSSQTRYRGWEYKPDNHRFLTGSSFIYSPTRPWQSVSMSLSTPIKNTYTNQVSKTKPYNLKQVKIVFSNTNTSWAYRYYNQGGVFVKYKNMVSVPFQAFEMDFTDSTAYPVQLNVAVIDTGWSETGGWNPSSDSLGGKLQIAVFGSAYDTNITSYKYNGANPRNFYLEMSSLDVYYVWAPRLISPGATFVDNDEFWIYPYSTWIPLRQGANYPTYYEFSTSAPVFGNTSIAKDQNALEKIRVVPNPYYGFSTLDRSTSDKFVTFRNLPLNCTIKIYTLNGDLIRTLVKTSTGTLSTSSTLEWNLQNVENTPVASGIYIALVDAPGIGTKVLKIAVFTSQERINF